MTIIDFTLTMGKYFWPWLLIGSVGTGLLLRDLVKKYRSKRIMYRIKR